MYKNGKIRVGEIILNSIDYDGMMNGYDLKLIENISKSISIPVVASCGAGKFDDFNNAIPKVKHQLLLQVQCLLCGPEMQY